MTRDMEQLTLRRRIARWRRSLTSRPERRDVPATIRESGLFDPDWYLERYPDVAAAGLDPLDHYATHGGIEGRKASPRFDGHWYSEHYPDVAASGLHPLVHYVTLGQGRQVVKRVGLPGVKTVESDFHDAADILASPLFDAVWYSARQDLKLKPEQVALHYLKVGAPAGSAPGPRFDGAAYLAAYADVRDGGGNPLLHFIRHGDAEGRVFAPVRAGATEPAPLPARSRTGALPPPVTDVVWRSAAKLKTRTGRALVETFGAALGTVLEVYDDQIAPLPDSLSQALHTFAALNRRALADEMSARGTRGPRSPSPERVSQARPCPVLIDAWFVNDATLRVRLDPTGQDRVARIYQGDAEGTLQLVGEALVQRGVMTLVDARAYSPFLPVLLVYCTLDGDLLGGDLLPFPSLLRGGLHAAELEAAGLGGSNASRRKGLEARLAHGADQASGLRTIEIDITSAHGAERIFSKPALEWLNWLGVSVQASESTRSDVASRHLVQVLAANGVPPRPRSAGQTLTLSAGCLPTLSALHRHGSAAGVGALLVADVGSPTPRWMVSPPADYDELQDVQPVGMPFAFPRVSGTLTKGRRARLGPLGVLFDGPAQVTDAKLTFPIAPDATGPLLKRGLTLRQRSRLSISAVIHVDGSADPVALLQSLARQTVVERVRVVVVVVADDNASIPSLQAQLKHFFPGRHRLVTSEESRKARIVNLGVEATAETDMLLFGDPRVDLHDDRTLETLYALADRKAVATAGCLMVREGGFKDGRLLQVQSAGIYPSHVSLLDAPLLTFHAPETIGRFPIGTYPVVGNDPRLMLVSRRAWDRLGGVSPDVSDDAVAIDFALRALSNGLTHLCTSAVSATSLETPQARFGGEIQAVGDITLVELAGLLDGTTIVRALS